MFEPPGSAKVLTEVERKSRHIPAISRAVAGLTQGLMQIPRQSAHVAIKGYQYSLSMLVGRQCRHWPSCSAYTDTAILRFGLWRGGWMGLARICRCNPWGTEGIDLVCEELPPESGWYRPWRYGRWRGVNAPSEDGSKPD
jgi:putative membrane protein insertion efficiency factor